MVVVKDQGAPGVLRWKSTPSPFKGNAGVRYDEAEKESYTKW